MLTSNLRSNSSVLRELTNHKTIRRRVDRYCSGVVALSYLLEFSLGVDKGVAYQPARGDLRNYNRQRTTAQHRSPTNFIVDAIKVFTLTDNLQAL